MTDQQIENSFLTVGTVGILAAVVTAIIYFMKLPIFTINGLAWFFVFALVSGAIGIASLIIKSIWENRGGY